MSSEAQEGQTSNKITCTDVTCPVCGITCDDIEVELDDVSVVTRNACSHGRREVQGASKPIELPLR